MLQQKYRREDPNFDQEMAEIAETYEEGDRHHYSAMLESMKEWYREQFPDEPDDDAIAKAEYDSYMAANPGLKERLALEEEEDSKANSYTEEQIGELIDQHNAMIDARPKVHTRVEIEAKDMEEIEV